MKKWRPRATDTCCTCLKNRTQAVGSSHARNYQHITAYTSCPEVADEHSKEWIASTVKEIITEMISSGELQISAQTPAPETNGSILDADDLAELGGVMGMFRTKG